MRIDLNTNLAEAQTPGKAASSANPSAGSVEVNIKALEGELAKVPEVRKEKVDSLREFVKSGNYEIDAQQVALAMMSDLTILRFEK